MSDQNVTSKSAVKLNKIFLITLSLLNLKYNQQDLLAQKFADIFYKLLWFHCSL